MLAALLLFQVAFATGLAPDTVTVGDPFRVVLRVSAPPGARVEFPPILLRNDTVGALAAAPEVAVDSAGVYTATYRAVAWVPGGHTLPTAALTVLLPGGVPQRYRVQPALPFVRSVLPADTAGLRPRGAKDVWGTDRATTVPWLLIALVALILLALLAWWLWRRRRPEVADSGLDPRQRALAALAELRPENTEAFYVQLSAVLREFLAGTSAEWGLHLASSELLDRLGASSVANAQLDTLHDLLRASDGVKFARSRPGGEEAERALSAAREWVRGFGRSEAKAA